MWLCQWWEPGNVISCRSEQSREAGGQVACTSSSAHCLDLILEQTKGRWIFISSLQSSWVGCLFPGAYVMHVCACAWLCVAIGLGSDSDRKKDRVSHCWQDPRIILTHLVTFLKIEHTGPRRAHTLRNNIWNAAFATFSFLDSPNVQSQCSHVQHEHEREEKTGKR